MSSERLIAETADLQATLQDDQLNHYLYRSDTVAGRGWCRRAALRRVTIDDDSTSFDSVMESMSVLIWFMIACSVVLGFTVLCSVGLINLSAREHAV